MSAGWLQAEISMRQHDLPLFSEKHLPPESVADGEMIELLERIVADQHGARVQLLERLAAAGADDEAQRRVTHILDTMAERQSQFLQIVMVAKLLSEWPSGISGLTRCEIMALCSQK